MFDLEIGIDNAKGTSSDDVDELPPSIIEALRAVNPEDARYLFQELVGEHRPNITALSMAAHIIQELCSGRKPAVTPLLQARRIFGTNRLEIEIDTPPYAVETGFNKTFLEALSLPKYRKNTREKLENLTQAHVGGFVVRLEAVTTPSQLTKVEHSFDVIPLPALRLHFDPIDY